MLTIMCGIPGSGKSTYLKNRGPTPIILCPDEFRLVLTSKDYYEPAEDSVWSHVKTAARVFLKQGYHVFIDSTNLTMENRKVWVRMAKEMGVHIECIWMNVPFKVSVEQNKKRSRVVPSDVMNKMCASFKPPLVSEGFTRVVRSY